MECTKCDLHKTRTKIVLGHGNKYANILFIGEAPGYHEDQQGKPFVGQAGKVFNKLLDSINLERDEIYLTNIVKCRPPKNRNPTDEEISKCSVYLDKELEAISPKIIIPMGTFATRYIFNKFGINFESMGKSHGLSILVKNTYICPIYHPAALIYNKELIPVTVSDMKKIANFL